jgi:hypothetical protein
MLCFSWLILVLFASDGVETVIHPTDALVLLAVLFLLVAVFIFAHLFSSNRLVGAAVRGRASIGLAIVLFLFLPQSSALYGRIAEMVQSDMVLFAVWNILDIAAGRLILALLNHDKTPLLSAPDNPTSP